MSKINKIVDGVYVHYKGGLDKSILDAFVKRVVNNAIGVDNFPDDVDDNQINAIIKEINKLKINEQIYFYFHILDSKYNLSEDTPFVQKMLSILATVPSILRPIFIGYLDPINWADPDEKLKFEEWLKNERPKLEKKIGIKLYREDEWEDIRRIRKDKLLRIISKSESK